MRVPRLLGDTMKMRDIEVTSRNHSRSHWRLAFVAGCAALFLAATVYAVPVGTVPVGDDDLFETTHDGKTFTCGRVSDDWLSGKLVGTSDFLSHKQQMKNAKKDLKTASGKKREKLLKLIAKLRPTMKTGTAACENGPGQDPDPTSSGTPRPTSTPPPSGGNFDANGNVTSQGKAAFGIPSNLSANRSQGQTLHAQWCAGCHGEKTNRSFSSLRTSIAEPTMGFTPAQISDQTLAHITAYLNRFRQ